MAYPEAADVVGSKQPGHFASSVNTVDAKATTAAAT